MNIELGYIDEPRLSFGADREHVDPRTGLALFGPWSRNANRRHPQRIQIGLIGSAEAISNTEQWLTKISNGIVGNSEHTSFSGFQNDRGFRTSLSFGSSQNAQITRDELDDLDARESDKLRFSHLQLLLEAKFRFLATRDNPPDVVVVVFPDSVANSMWSVEYDDPELGHVRRNLRAMLKAAAQRERIPVQVIQERTVAGKADDDPRDLAWNLFTAIYSKAGGAPWAPTGLSTGSCYVGISFFSPLGDSQAHLKSSIVQAFDEYGEGLVLRGQEFKWDSVAQGSRAPHLSAELAHDLMAMVLEQYKTETGRTPSRVVIHKTSHFWPAELDGFRSYLKSRVPRSDFVTINTESSVKLFPKNQYPVYRGTFLRSEEIDYLYTTGYIAAMGRYHGPHVPSPLQISDHLGRDTARTDLLREILTLTKLNYNSSRIGGLLPITLKFSYMAARVLRELPVDKPPLPNFKYYM